MCEIPRKKLGQQSRRHLSSNVDGIKLPFQLPSTQVCEIPKWTRKKFELATKEALNPIKQDEKKGEVPTSGTRNLETESPRPHHPLEIARHPVLEVTCKHFALPLEPF